MQKVEGSSPFSRSSEVPAKPAQLSLREVRRGPPRRAFLGLALRLVIEEFNWRVEDIARRAYDERQAREREQAERIERARRLKFD